MKNCLFLLLAICFFTAGQAQPDSTDTLAAPPAFDLEVQAVDKVVLLKWTLAYSEDLKGFDIERAENGENNFVKVGSKLAISKGSDATYDFVDATPKRNVALRYRLKLIAQNGSISYSDFRETRLAEVSFSVRLKQNPIRENLEMEVVTTAAKQASIIVISTGGLQV
ncbi:MAG TPA: hypothetical protein VGE06_07750, partial [Flavisolibacter sp.]